MSGKSRVRRTRRTNTHDEDHHELKLDDSIDQSDDNKSTKSNATTTTNETEKLDTSFKEETNGHGDTTPPSPPKDKTTATTTTETASPKKQTDEPIIEKTNGQPDDDIANETPAEKPETIKNGEDQSSIEMEPISIDSEDPELQFTSEQNSDKSSEVELSPTLNRCRTRRSHTRNLPTPKTPKIHDDLNGDVEKQQHHEEEEEEDKPQIETPEVIITIADDTPPEENSENVSLASNISIDGSSVEEKTLDLDLANASIFVNLGNDTTKNFDITVQSSNNFEDDSRNMSNFLETTKDKSYGETLRCLTGRKTARNYHFQVPPPRMYSSTIELHSKDLTDSAKKYTPSMFISGGGGGVKRKLDAESPSDKRMRTEDVSPGILSYLTSPFKNKMGRTTEVPSSSTPKLTAFKYVHHGSTTTVIDEVVSKVDLDCDEKSAEPKKWCSIM